MGNLKVRKAYTKRKNRESWSEPEHDKFLEAFQLFDRDWKKIAAFVGSKTISQIRSHAQKCSDKAKKTGAPEPLPPPRPKRKAAHPYPQNATYKAPVLPPVSGSFEAPPVLPDPIFIRTPNSSLALQNTAVSHRSDNVVQAVYMTHSEKGDTRSSGQVLANNCCSSKESTSRAWPKGNHNSSLRVLPDFAQVYGFIGSVFDPCASNHLQKLKKMDPIDVETALLLMQNLSVNLTSPDFEEYRRFLSYELDPRQDGTSGSIENSPMCC